ncbi:rhodanese-like domain-containing protein [bacterium]|nr:rhodanese-like domain-containing protein [bacterium]
MIHEISVAEAHEALKADKNAKLIDVRTPEEFAQVHAKGAIHIVLGAISKASLAAAGITDKSAALYLICKSGGRSRQACVMLAAEGFTNLSNVSGGTMAWVNEDLPHE